MQTLSFPLMLNILAGGMLLAGVLIPGRARVRSLLRLFALQSLFLAIIAILTATIEGHPHLYITAALTILIKTIGIPLFLVRILNRGGVAERLHFVFRPTLSMFAALATVVLGFYLTISLVPALAENYFIVAVSICLVFLGFLMLMIRKGLYGQIVGFLLMENGIFTFGLALTGGMPLLVEIGVFFDVTIGAVIMALLSYRVHAEHKRVDTEALETLID